MPSISEVLVVGDRVEETAEERIYHEARMLETLSKAYVSIHAFNIGRNDFRSIKTNPFIEECLSIEGDIQVKTNNVMWHVTKSEDREMILDFCNLSTVEERMGDDDIITTVFHGAMSGWCKACFIRSEAPRKQDDTREIIFTVECIDEEKHKEDHLLYMAQTDLLTGICNRGYGERSIGELLAAKTQGMFCLFDVDKFKQINDKCGHDLGDQVLISIADALRKAQRAGDVVMRLGGDEYAAYFVGVRTSDEAGELIRCFFEEIAAIKVEPMVEEVSVSMGAVMYRDGLDFETAYREADRGVYGSKINKGSTFNLS